jgi:hypothetical protein
MVTLREIADGIRESLAARSEVMLAYVFGSRAREDAGPLSDVDVALALGPDVEASRHLRLRAELAESLGGVLDLPVEVVILNEAPPLLAHRAIARGKLVFSRSEAFRVRFETARIAEYLDTRVLDAEYNRALEERIRKGRLLGRS